MGAPRLVSETPPGLDALVESDPRSVLFLRPRWLSALARAYPDFRVRYLAAGEPGRLRGVLPLMERRWLGLRETVSLPFGTYGGPLLADPGDGDTARDLAAAFLARARRPFSFRWEMTVADAPPRPAAGLEAVLGRWRRPGRTLTIDLGGGPDAVWEAYEGRARTSVRKSVQSGVTVAVEPGAAALDVLHRLHAAQGRTREVPWHHSRRALDAVAEVLGPEEARVFVARHRGEPVCAALVLSRVGREAIPWVTGARPESRPLNAFHHLMHTAIRDAAARGCRTWNFGASAESDRVERFKTAFGARPKPLLRYFHESAWVPRLRRFKR